MAYIGTQPKDVRSFGRAKFDFTATQGQTAFTGADDDSKTLGFTDGQIEVYVNGILMDESDFTTSNSNTVTLASAANLNDIISIVAMQTDIPNSDYVPASGGTFTGQTIHDQNILVGKTASDGAVAGHELRPASFAIHTRAGGAALGARRITNNGDIAFFENANGAVGYIGTPWDGEMYVEAHGANSSGLLFTSGNTIQPRKNRAADDGNITIGASGNRFKDLYLSGGAYLGGTGASNKLDDYEEGTWTPTFSSGYSGMSYAVQFGSYTKIGNTVRAFFRIALSGGSSLASVIAVTGFPFTAANHGHNYVTATSYINSSSANGDSVKPILFPNTSTVYLYYQSATAVTQLVGTNHGSGLDLIGQIVYEA